MLQTGRSRVRYRRGDFFKFKGCWGEFGLKRDEVTGEWRKLHNEELRDLYSPPSIIRMITYIDIRSGIRIGYLLNMKDRIKKN
jgi:hypothetical protein